MTSNKKQKIKRILIASFLINLVIYAVTFQRLYGNSELYFTHPILKPFYANQSGGVNLYYAGGPLTSRAVHYNGVEGCPCGGVSKLGLIWKMTATLEFLGNLLIWSILPATYMWLKRQK